MIEIDGSFGEGGGQILRYALVYSIITGKDFKIYNIRKGRTKPGLKAQHLNILKALKIITDSEVKGDNLGSLEVEFIPGDIKGGDVFLDFKTAGSIPLFLQTLLPVSVFSRNPVYLHLKGGTDVPGGPTMDYFENVILKPLRPLLDKFDLKVLRRGYYPKGGGEVKIFVKGKYSIEDFKDIYKIRNILKEKLNLNFEKGKLLNIQGIIVSSDSLKGRKVCERIKKSAEDFLFRRRIKKFSFKFIYQDSYSPGCSFTLWGEFDKNAIIGYDVLCKKGVPAEEVGKRTVFEFLNVVSSNSVDYHLSDNLVFWLSLAGGKIFIDRLTSHFVTAVEIARMFIDFDYKREGNKILFSV